RKGDKKVMLQNGFYDDMSRSGVFRMHNAFAELLGFRVKQIYQVVRGVEKKFICLKNKLGQAFRKFVGYEFKCERYLIMKF
ncbi:MAGa4850 family ICE element protein, partial [Mycoplasma sp. HS2188]|uniref:MAGa4850 family ICE element protein n=1 Tax=Mycoplasma sp. HS2188 TaxID=2976765 RepID=UPI0021AA03AD